SVFKRIAEAHDSIIGLKNCKLEGNQNNVMGRVQIHSIVCGLINESMKVKFRGISFDVKVIEEVSDITEIKMEDVYSVNCHDKKDRGWNENNNEDAMVVSDNDEEDGESINGSNGEDEESDADVGDKNRPPEEELKPRSVEKDDRKDEEELKPQGEWHGAKVLTI
ncbi:hypothetical protein Tco_0591648, partial [Tanacetum coccineum]